MFQKCLIQVSTDTFDIVQTVCVLENNFDSTDFNIAESCQKPRSAFKL